MKRFADLTALTILLALTVVSAHCGESREVRAKRLAEVLGLKPGSVVADIGAGDGEWTIELARLVAPEGRVLANEIDEEALSKLKKAVRRSRLDNVDATLGAEDRTGLEADSCDAVLLRHVYHHFTQPEAMRADLLRILKPGGLLAVVDFNPDKSLSRSNVPKFRKGHGVEPDAIQQELTAAGFSLVDRREKWEDGSKDFLLLFQRPEGSAP